MSTVESALAAPREAWRDAIEDPQRLAALAETGLLDAPATEAFERLIRLATRLVGAPISLVSLVDRHRQFFTSQVGLGEAVAEARETPLTHSFCKHVVHTQSPLIVTDARQDPLVRDNLAIADLGVVAYLGVPLRAPEGECIGAFCAIDTVPRRWTPADRETLADLAELAAIELERAHAVRAAKRTAEAERLQRLARERLAMQLQLVIDNVSDLVWVTDHEGRYAIANRATAGVLGRPLDEVVGRTPADVMSSTLAADAAGVDREVLRSGVPVTRERWMETPDGVRCFRVATHPFRDIDDAIAGTVSIAADISVQKETEQRLVAAREHALATARMRGTFLANMSHEIRTPLNGVLGLLQLLDGTVAGVEHQQYVAAALASGRHLLHIIDDILDLSRLEAGKVELSAQPVHVPSLVGEVAQLFVPDAAARGLAVAVEADGRMPMLLVDAIRLRQIVLNLVGNACKFTATGGVTIRASLDEAPAGATLQIEVIDTGIGIALEAADTIFAAFQQEDASTTRRFGGTGLGLAISRNLATLMGGTLTVRSRRGEGSTFTLALPATVAAVPAPTAVPVAGSGLTPEPSVEGRRILVAEDSPVGCLVARRILERLGATVDEARDGAQAIALASAREYDLILMDCQMPEVDGFEATAALRSLEAAGRRRVPIVALTAHAMDGDRDRCLAAGMDDYLTKPVDAAALRSVVSRWVGARA